MLRPLLLAPLFATLVAAPAEATIVPGRSIAGVSLGDAKATVDARLGASSNQQNGEVIFSRKYPKGRLTVGFEIETQTVAYLTTRSVRQRTAAGIGPGVRVATMRRRLRGEHCSRLIAIDDDGSQTYYGSCIVTSRDRTTDFVYGLRSRKVIEVMVRNG